jgi:hypothetical protein
LGISRKAVGEWEAGITYPKAEHLKAFIALADKQQAIPAGREEISTFWHAARQKMLLDEVWLGTLLADVDVSSASLKPGYPTGRIDREPGRLIYCPYTAY